MAARHASYDDFAEHLETAGRFPTYLPWPMSPGWSVSDFGVVGGRAEPARATMTCCSGTSQLDGPVDVLVVAEEAGTGLGARCAGLPGDGPATDLRPRPRSPRCTWTRGRCRCGRSPRAPSSTSGPVGAGR